MYICIYLSTFVSINPNTSKFHITKTCRSVYHDFYNRRRFADRSSLSSLINFVAAVIAHYIDTLFALFYVTFFFVALYLRRRRRRYLVTHPRSLNSYDCSPRTFCQTKFSDFASPESS